MPDTQRWHDERYADTMRYSGKARRPKGRDNSPPTWFVFVLGVALVFGGYYVVQGVQNFIRTGGRGVVELTQGANIVASATAERATRMLPSGANITPRPSSTPIPACQTFVVDVPNAIVRDAPLSGGAILTSLSSGAEVCVLNRVGDGEWFAIDLTAETRRLDLAYMHESVIRALNPTPTPTITATPLPTITPAPSATWTLRPPPLAAPEVAVPTRTPAADAIATEPPTAVPTATPIRQSA